MVSLLDGGGLGIEILRDALYYRRLRTVGIQSRIRADSPKKSTRDKATLFGLDHW